MDGEIRFHISGNVAFETAEGEEKNQGGNLEGDHTQSALIAIYAMKPQGEREKRNMNRVLPFNA